MPASHSAKEVAGRFATAFLLVSVFLLALMLVLPWRFFFVASVVICTTITRICTPRACWTCPSFRRTTTRQRETPLPHPPASCLLCLLASSPQMTKAVEDAVRECGMGLNPNSEGQGQVHVPIPKPTKESRQAVAKVAAKNAEKVRAPCTCETIFF